MRIFQSKEVEVTIPASPRAKRLPQGSLTPVPLRQIRQELNMTDSEVARVAMLSPSEVTQLEAHQVPAIHQLTAYARALGGELQLTISFGAKTYQLNMDLDAAPESDAELSSGWGDLDDPFPESAPLLDSRPRNQND
jgi:transcriptional regulator with XRE-family HTH domain